MLLIPPRPWTASAACLNVDPDLFFPRPGESLAQAKKVCAGCAVRADCLEFALKTRESFGVWGGLSDRERRHLRRDRQAGKVAATVIPDVVADDQPLPVNAALTAKASGAGQSAGAAVAAVTTPQDAVQVSGGASQWRKLQAVERPALPGLEPDDGKQPCPLCGFRFRRLGQHLRQRHDRLDVWVYRHYGLVRSGHHQLEQQAS